MLKAAMIWNICYGWFNFHQIFDITIYKNIFLYKTLLKICLLTHAENLYAGTSLENKDKMSIEAKLSKTTETDVQKNKQINRHTDGKNIMIYYVPKTKRHTWHLYHLLCNAIVQLYARKKNKRKTPLVADWLRDWVKNKQVYRGASLPKLKKKNEKQVWSCMLASGIT